MLEATLRRPVMCFVCLACLLSLLSGCPWRIASQKQKLLLASQFVFLLLLLLLFPWCRSVGPPLFYLYSSAVVILLHERGREGTCPPLPSSLDPCEQEEEKLDGFPLLLSFPSQEVHSHDICCIQSADLSSPHATAAAMRTMEAAAAAFICTAVWRPLSMIPAVRQLPLGGRSRWQTRKMNLAMFELSTTKGHNSQVD